MDGLNELIKTLDVTEGEVDPLYLELSNNREYCGFVMQCRYEHCCKLCGEITREELSQKYGWYAYDIRENDDTGDPVEILGFKGRVLVNLFGVFFHKGPIEIGDKESLDIVDVDWDPELDGPDDYHD